MSPKFGLAVCSGADFDKEFQDKYDIRLVPTRIMVNDEEFIDRVNIFRDELIEQLLTNSAKTSTSVAPPQDYQDIFKKAIEDYGEVLFISISTKMSAVYENALLAIRKLKTDKITCYNTENVSYGETIFLAHAAKRREDGLSIQEIVAELDQMKKSIKVYFFVNTLDYLVRGGRIGKAKGLIGKLVGAKPLLTVKDGETTPYETVKGDEEKGIDRLIELARQDMESRDNIVLYSVYGVKNEYFDERVKELYDNPKIIEKKHLPIGANIISHVGPLVQGIVVVEIPENAKNSYSKSSFLFFSFLFFSFQFFSIYFKS